MGPSRRTVLLHGGVYTASRLANQAVTFLLLPLYAHLLGSAGMGVVEVMNVARSFLGVFLVQGLDGAWFRLRFEIGDKEELRRFESSVVWYLAASGIFGIAVLAIVGPFIGSSLTPGVPFVPLGLWAAATAVANAFGLLVEKRLQAEGRPVAFAAWSLVRTLTTLGSIVVFVAILRKGAPGKIQAEAMAACALALAALVVLRPAASVSGADIRRALLYGLPFVPHAAAGLVNDLVDRYLLSAFVGLPAVGVYSMGYRLAGIGMMVAVAVSQALAPAFIETVRKADSARDAGDHGRADEHRKHVTSLGFVTVLAACTAALGVTAFAREVLAVATTPEFAESWTIVAPVSAGVVAWGWYATLSQSVLYRPETVRRLLIVTAAAAASNIAANLVLIPRFGIHGAAWSTAFSNAVMAACALVLGMKCLPLPYPFRRWALVTGWTFVSLAVTVVLDEALPSVLTRVTVKAAWLGISLAVMVTLSGIPLRSIRSLWRPPAGAAGSS